jgi:hypothetical protein
MQPGIVEKYNLQAGAIGAISKAEKDLTENIIKRGMAEAKAELIREKMKDFMTNQIDGASFMDMFYGAILPNFNANDLFNKRQSILQQEIDALAALPTGNPFQAKTDSISQSIQTNNATVDLNINDPNNRVTAKSSAPMVKINTTSTTGQR